jgi:hypothetical protein
MSRFQALTASPWASRSVRWNDFGSMPVTDTDAEQPPEARCLRGPFMGLGRFERPTSRLSGGSRGDWNTAACHKNPDRTRDLPMFHFPAARPCPAVWTPIWTPILT